MNRWALHELDRDERSDAATQSKATMLASTSTRPLFELNQSSSSWFYVDPRSASDLCQPLRRGDSTRRSIWLQGRHRGVLGGDEINENDDYGNNGGNSGVSASWGKSVEWEMGSSGGDVDDDRRYLVSLMRAEHAANGGGMGGEGCEPDLAAAATEASLVCLRRLPVAHAGTHTASQLRLELRCSSNNGQSISDISAVYLFALATNSRSNASTSSRRSGWGGRRLVGTSILCFEDSSHLVVAPALGNGDSMDFDGTYETRVGSPPMVKITTGTEGRWQSLDCAPLLCLEAGEVLSLWALPWPRARALLLAVASSNTNGGGGNNSGNSNGLAGAVEALGAVVGSQALCVEARRVQLSRSEHVASITPHSNHSATSSRDPEGAVFAAATAASAMPATMTFASTTPMHYAQTGANWL